MNDFPNHNFILNLENSSVEERKILKLGKNLKAKARETVLPKETENYTFGKLYVLIIRFSFCL